jgi:hyaluronoglucosaminidase
MENIKNVSIIGYIEGYYGRLLNWEHRILILKSLHQNKMNTYFYAPKEDLKNRLNWRVEYGENWRYNFRTFTSFAKKEKINIIAGIAPGLDFNFKKFKLNSRTQNNSDFDLLLNKSRQLLKDGASDIALLLDDIPDNYYKNYGYQISEGSNHALLANKLSEELGHSIYFVPRIYADELILDNKNYLLDLSKVIKKNIKVFYCGRNVVSKTIKSGKAEKISKILTNKIIYWDNYYANDYCPRKLFLGPWKGRKGIKNILINPTGMIKTDLLIIDIVSNSILLKTYNEALNKALKKNKIPQEFKNLIKFFNYPIYNQNIKNTKIEITKSTFDSIETLLWKWKSDISIEWYPYLLGLKHDLQLNLKILPYDRIVKTQTNPLSNMLLKNYKI